MSSACTSTSWSVRAGGPSTRTPLASYWMLEAIEAGVYISDMDSTLKAAEHDRSKASNPFPSPASVVEAGATAIAVLVCVGLVMTQFFNREPGLYLDVASVAVGVLASYVIQKTHSSR